MHLVWEINPSGCRPEFSISHEVIDYYIQGFDAITHSKWMPHGFPEVIIRWACGGWYVQQYEEGIAIHQALSVLNSESYDKVGSRIEEILARMPKQTMLRHEHGAPGNTVTFSNRSKDGGIGVHLHKPFYSDDDYFEYLRTGKMPDERFLQEARILIVPTDARTKGDDDEAIVYATVEQINAILNLSLAIEKLPPQRA